MPRQYTAQSVASVNPLHFVIKDGEMVAIICNCEVNYGELGMTHQIDLWGDLTDAQKQQARAIYQLLRNKVTQIILGD